FNDTKLVKERFKGIQANTSSLSYSELDGAVDLKCSEPEDFSSEMIKLSHIGSFQIWGGCCGTDHRHMECVARKLVL
ncbi:MAG: homocysteine S-methyltransferase family protein, partial [Lachnospiraceae bacterium]|nr:homocysteine S-methyltransferase family protein [Lachnospiraceae bacterium]